MRTTSSTLIAIMLVLLGIGIVMLASTSSVKAEASFADPYYFLKRQLISLALAAVVGAAVYAFDYHWWQKPPVALALAVLFVGLLVAVRIPHVGVKAGGSYRWLRLGPLSLQPSEMAKFAVVVLMSAWMMRQSRVAHRFRAGLLYPGAGLGLVLLLLLAEPDFGTTLLVAAVGLSIMFAGGTRVGYLAIGGALGAFGFGLAVVHDPVRMGRILAFLNPDAHPKEAYHLAQSLLAFINGGWFGVGLGNSIQKQFYLPEAHTDFILAIIGEELGFVATALIVTLFLGILVCGLLIAFRAPDPFGRLVAFGTTVLIVMQAAINIGVVTGCLPTKGLPLPFISYGGSSLIVSVACVCLLLNIARHVGRDYPDEHTRVVRDGLHRFDDATAGGEA